MLQEPPDSYESDPTVAHILEFMRSDDKSPILVTGEAGTGKSTLVNYIKTLKDVGNTVVLAPTGVAALNVGGQTIHSFFRFPFQIIDENALADQRPNRLWKKVELVVIDEISMVRADILDGIDIVLREAQIAELPFGGCRMLFVGDFEQLPPVIPAREEAVLAQFGYSGPYAYNAKVLENYPPVHFELTRVYRQKDPHFVRLLSDIRAARNIDAAVSELNELCVGRHRPGHMPIMLTATNAIAERYNARGLDAVHVKFDSGGAVRKIEPAKWDAINYKWNEAAQKMEETTKASFEQIPLILAWAVTIHKAQGLTLDDVRIDLGNGAFASGQTYVALSRARTLEGLSLTAPLRIHDVPDRTASSALSRW